MLPLFSSDVKTGERSIASNHVEYLVQFSLLVIIIGVINVTTAQCVHSLNVIEYS